VIVPIIRSPIFHECLVHYRLPISSRIDQIFIAPRTNNIPSPINIAAMILPLKHHVIKCRLNGRRKIQEKADNQGTDCCCQGKSDKRLHHILPFASDSRLVFPTPNYSISADPMQEPNLIFFTSHNLVCHMGRIG